MLYHQNILLQIHLNLILMQFLREGGLALATSICSWLQVVVLLLLAKRKLVLEWRVRETLLGAGLMLLASVVAGGFAILILTILPTCPPNAGTASQKMWRLIQVVLAGGAGGTAYLLASLLMNRPEVLTLREVLLRRRKNPST